MVPQEIFPFKLERTDELLTSRGGLTIFSEAMRALQVEKKIRAAFPHPGSNRGYEAWSYIEPLVLMLIGGGRHVEDLREIRDDQALRALIGLDRLPSSSTVGDWLMRWGKRGGRKAMTTVNEDVARMIVNRTGCGDLTLDIDGTVIESDKEEAEWTYEKVKGYQPILGFLAENSVCLASEFRSGNVPGHSQALKFFKRCLKLCPKIKTLRSDSAFYQADIIGWCQEKELGFTITADQNNSVKEAIRTVRDWTPLMDKKGWSTDREVGTAIHSMPKTEAFQLVVQRWWDPQLLLFEPNGYSYYIIATNRDDLSAREVVLFHNQRGKVENSIKELKIGMGMEQMTSGDFKANALWFAIGVLAYNLAAAQKLLFLGPEWKTKTIASVRWQLLQLAGRLVRHGRRVILRLAITVEKMALLLETRGRIAAII